MIHVLTTDRRARSQLSLLLHDLGEQPVFADSIESLRHGLDSKGGAKVVLLDNSIQPERSQVQALKSDHSTVKVIGFDNFQAGVTPEKYAHADLLEVSILLPVHVERAKTRLRNALRQLNPSTPTKRTGQTRPPIAFKRPASKIAAKVASYKKSAQPTANSAILSARYLTTESLSGATFIEQLAGQTKEDTLCILNGEDGAEFELAARELNYQLNADKTPLSVIPSNEIGLDALEKIERDAAKKKIWLNCFVGRTDDLDEEQAIELGLFIEYLENLRNPHIRIILAHAFGSESFFKEGSSVHLKTIVKKRAPLTIPPLQERPEDIAPICRKLLAALRTAHPFLMVYSISNEAIEYLISQSAELSHSKLIRILRNSIGLSQRNSLCVEDLKNYGESDTTTQHLLESMADEGFFPQSEAANS